jgi:hypothetical protein
MLPRVSLQRNLSGTGCCQNMIRVIVGIEIEVRGGVGSCAVDCRCRQRWGAGGIKVSPKGDP